MSIELSRKLRKRMSPVEATMWNGLRTLSGYHFRRQVPFGRYFADFACHRARLVIELDGDTHAFSHAYDQDRDRFMRSQGYEVMRFPNNEVMGNLDGVLLMVLNWLEAHPAAGPAHRARGSTPPQLR